MYKHCILLAIAAMLMATAGCGSGLPAVNVVTGTVTYDGQPLAGATVAFHPDEKNAAGTASRAASGVTDDSGNFKLTMQFADGSSVSTLEGAPTGGYRVTVTKMESNTDFEGEAVDPTAGETGEDGNNVNNEYMSAMGNLTESGGGGMEEKSLISTKFRLAYETPLTADVKEGDNSFTITLNANGQGSVE